MHYSNNKNLYTSYFFYSYLLITWLSCAACKNYFTKDDHPKYFSPVFKTYDSIGNNLKEQGLVYLDSAFYAFPNPGTGDKYELLKRKRDFYADIKKDYDKSISYSDSILLLLKEKIDKPRFAVLYSRILFLKGDIYFSLKKQMEGFHYYTLGKQVIVDKVRDPCAMAGYDGRLANMYYRQGKYLLAAPYYVLDFKTQTVCDKDDNFGKLFYQQSNLDNAGESYAQAGMQDSAFFYYNAALDYINKEAPRFPGNDIAVEVAKAVIYGNQAEVLAKKGHTAVAETLFIKSIAGTKVDDPGYTQSTRLRLAGMYLENMELQKADKILLELKRSLDSFKNDAALTQWYKLKADFYDKSKQTEAAYESLQQYSALKDSVEFKGKQFTALNVTSELENVEQRAINELLKKDNELKAVYLLVAAVTSVMAIAIILLVWNNLRRSGKHVKKLQSLNGEINQKNEDLQKTLASLEQSHHENTRITRIVAHDLRNPISAIHNLVYSLLKKEQQSSVKEVLELIKTACVNSITLIKDLLNEKKQLADIRKELVDMAKLLEYCVELLQAKADEKNQHIQLEAHPAMIMLNRQKMWRVISNIVNNAIKFSPQNSEINIKLEKKEKTVLLSVKDNGIGIPAELKDKIFVLAPESSRPGTAGEESHGLGLSISQKIIEEHDGKIWFESEAGEGSVFYVELPFAN